MRIHETGPVLPGTERRDGDEVAERWRIASAHAGPAVMKERKKSGESGATPRPISASAETPEARADRTREIKFKILEGAYDSLEAVDQLARRILSSGDM